jgi:hypothetical protein
MLMKGLPDPVSQPTAHDIERGLKACYRAINQKVRDLVMEYEVPRRILTFLTAASRKLAFKSFDIAKVSRQRDDNPKRLMRWGVLIAASKRTVLRNLVHRSENTRQLKVVIGIVKSCRSRRRWELP